MLGVLAAILALLCLGILLRHYYVRKSRDELLSMKRHAATYPEQNRYL